MGGFTAQVQNDQTGQPSSKGGGQSYNTSPKPLDGIENAYFAQAPRPMGKGGTQTNSATSGQPTVGAPNKYSNTVGQWDNTQQQLQSQSGGGKGKG